MTSNKLDVARPLSDAGALSLTSGLLLFAPLVLLGNAMGVIFKYPDVGAAVLYPPYAALTAALMLSRRRDWVWYILVGLIAHFATHWPRWSPSWVLFADLANIRQIAQRDRVAPLRFPGEAARQHCRLAEASFSSWSSSRPPSEPRSARPTLSGTVGRRHSGHRGGSGFSPMPLLV